MTDDPVREMLDAVKSFQEEHTMTEEEAAALSDTAPKNRPTVQPKTLPARPANHEESKQWVS